jgi:hypothetical protein
LRPCQLAARGDENGSTKPCEHRGVHHVLLSPAQEPALGGDQLRVVITARVRAAHP